MVINNNNAPPTIYVNNVESSGNSVVMRLAGTRSNRDAIGARVRLMVAGKTMTRQVEAGSGYASEAMLPLHFGLGTATQIEAVEISWPSGLVQRFDERQTRDWVNKMLRIEEGVDDALQIKLEQKGPHTEQSSSRVVALKLAAQRGSL